MKQKTVDKWIKEQCVSTLSLVCEAVYPKFQKYGVKFPMLKFRKMISRWGSCQPKRGILTFNISLIEAPMACIEYVVVHEFTHFLLRKYKVNSNELFNLAIARLESSFYAQKCGLENLTID